MTIELQCLIGAVAILAVLLIFQGTMVPALHGFKYGLGPRDDPRQPSIIQGRLNRTVANHLESMAMFAPLALIAKAIAVSNPLTQTGAIVYVVFRASFAAAYALGIPGIRSIMWGISTAGTAMLAAGLFQ